MSQEEIQAANAFEEEEDIAEPEEFIHPKILANYKFIDAVSQITVEEGDRDVTYGITVAISPADGDLEELDIELTREDDIYFLTRCTLTYETFDAFKKEQHLRKTETFATFVESLTTMLKNVTSNRTTFKAVFENDKLTFRQQLEFKAVRIFTLAFAQVDESDEYVRAQAQFRFSEKQHFLSEQLALLNDLFEHVERKNPQLCQQLKRGSKFAQKEK